MNAPGGLVRSLRLSDATMLVIGCIVGVGIFRAASSIAGHVASPALTLVLWTAGGVVSLFGALCYAELAAMYPASGGDYVYITEIYGRFWGFLFGWTKLFIERTGTIAILGFVFAEYLQRVVPMDQTLVRVAAGAAILLLTAVNVAGLRWGTAVQNVFTLIKIAALCGVIAVGASTLAGGTSVAVDWSLPEVDLDTVQAMGIAFVFVLWTYGGWTEAAYVAEEVDRPTRNVPRAIVGGVLLTTVLYVLVNFSYLVFIPAGDIARTKLVASQVMQTQFGYIGAVFMAMMIACSAFGALNGYILTGGRILYAMGRDHALFDRLGTVHPTLRTPARALWVNALVAIVLVCTKTFDQIATYSTVVIEIFFIMTVAGVIVLRIRKPAHPRPYRAWGYPLTPLLFCLAMTGFLGNALMKEPRETAFGVGLLLLGIPLYLWSARLTRKV